MGCIWWSLPSSAEAAGLHFEQERATGQRLDQALGDAAATIPESLPLLEHVLSLLYNKQSAQGDGLLRWSDYRERGELKGALAQHAKAVFSTLQAREQRAFPLVMRYRVTLGHAEKEVIFPASDVTIAEWVDNGLLTNPSVTEEWLRSDGQPTSPAFLSLVETASLEMRRLSLDSVSVRMRTHTIRFPGSREAQLLWVAQGASAREIIGALGILPPRAVVCLNGGTARLDEDLASRLESLLIDGLARVIAEEGLTVVTGGTDAGIFSLFGKGVEKWGHPAPVVGVVPEKLVRWPGGGAGDTPLEPHHSHFVLVEGTAWGDETGTMYGLVEEWGIACPTVAVFAGGGEVTVREMRFNVEQGRQMILLAGSGRTTDAVLAARSGESAGDPSIGEIAARGRIIPFDLHGEAPSLATLVRQLLFEPPKQH